LVHIQPKKVKKWNDESLILEYWKLKKMKYPRPKLKEKLKEVKSELKKRKLMNKMIEEL